MIELKSITKDYGRLRAVTDVSFTCPDGRITGLLGVNGAGKTTLLNIVTGCMPPTSGSIQIDGLDLKENGRDCRRHLGYLPERPPLYDEMTVRDYLTFVCRLREVEKAGIRHHVDNIMDLCGLSEVRDRLLGHLSKGYRQRAGIAQALCGDPPVLILDEPTVGLDPRQVAEIRELIRTLGKDHTVLFSSHMLTEVQSLCQKIVILHHGKVIREETLSELEQEGRTSEIRLSVRAKPGELQSVLRDLPGFRKLQVLESTKDGYTEGLLTVSGDTDTAGEKLFRLLAARDLPLRLLAPKKEMLEEVFLQVTGQEGESV